QDPEEPEQHHPPINPKRSIFRRTSVVPYGITSSEVQAEGDTEERQENEAVCSADLGILVHVSDAGKHRGRPSAKTLHGSFRHRRSSDLASFRAARQPEGRWGCRRRPNRKTRVPPPLP